MAAVSAKRSITHLFLPHSTYFICSAVPPDVALVIAQAASFRVLNSALLKISTSIGMILESITACIKTMQVSTLRMDMKINIQDRKMDQLAQVNK